MVGEKLVFFALIFLTKIFHLILQIKPLNFKYVFLGLRRWEAAPAGIISTYYAGWLEFPINQEPMHHFSSVFSEIREIRWIQIFVIKYLFTTSTHTFDS